jgi:two-component system CheB/CheR fusion protein
MHHRNELLNQLNNDLSNLLSSVSLPMVMVGPDLSVRRYTPQASRGLGLTATDVGRPITRLRLKLEIGNLEQLMLDVIGEVRTQQLRVRNDDGQWCDVRLTPYRTADNRIDGVVLTVLSFEDLEAGDGLRLSRSGGSKAKKAAKKGSPVAKKRNRKK